MQSKKSKVSSKLWAALAAAGIIAGAGTMAYQFSYAETAPQVEMNHKVVPLFNNPPAAPATNVAVNAPNFASIVKAYGSAVVHINVKGETKETVQQQQIPKQFQNDPFFRFFQQFNNGQQQEVPTEGLGSGFIISSDG
ncbi:MAG: peptidase, partial [Betaproteobacteria bacterium]|nr:peptidase [Betaproteobacteria bacterium]